MSEPLGPRHPAVRDLRALLRDRAARELAGRFVLEGPLVIDAALDRNSVLDTVYAGVDSADAAVVARARAAGVPVRMLAAGVAERVGSTVTPQGLFATAPLHRRGAEVLDDLPSCPLVVVAALVADPGNAGTLVRSAEAAGADAIVFGAGSVDAYNPKVVRASAGAILGVPIVEGVSAVQILEILGERGLQRLGAVAAGGTPPDAADLTGPVALVLGHEARGLAAELPLDGRVTIPMAGPAESLNVAMAGTVLVFEAARQRRCGAR